MARLFALKANKLHYRLACFLFLTMGATVLIALGLQHIGGYIPCKLCLEERVPYYSSLTAIAIVLAFGNRPPLILIRLVFLTVLAFMLYNVGLSIYHAGAEWKFWAGPSDCTTAAAIITENALNLLDNLNAARPASCDEASLVVFGLSLAGWNVLMSLFCALVAGWGVVAKIKKVIN